MLETRIKKVLSQMFTIPIESINDNTSYDNVPKWDSLAHMNLVIALEEEFAIKFNHIQMMEMLSYPLIVLTMKEILQPIAS